MLSFEVVNNGRAVQIHCDDAGISKLIETLTKLRGSGSHVHLWADPSLAGQLSYKSPYGDDAITEVIISHGGDPEVLPGGGESGS